MVVVSWNLARLMTAMQMYPDLPLLMSFHRQINRKFSMEGEVFIQSIDHTFVSMRGCNALSINLLSLHFRSNMRQLIQGNNAWHVQLNNPPTAKMVSTNGGTTSILGITDRLMKSFISFPILDSLH